MSETFIPFSPPQLGDEEIAEVVDSLKSGWITTGPKTRAFEEEFRDANGAPAALALSSCTAALHLAIDTLGIGPGDEVITTPLTFVATVNAIEHVGARPVLADVEPDTLNLDPERVAAAITPATRALLPVHYGGHPVDLDAFAALAEPAGLHVIEDAAHAVSARYKGRLIGSSDNPAAFSFYATKNMTTAEGGMLTGPAEFIDRARIASLHGMSRDAWKRYGKGGSWYYEVVMPGFKYNMTDLQAAIGRVQLRRLPAFQQRRAEVVGAYDRAFADCEALQTPVCRPEVEHAWHLYALRLNLDALSISRNQFIDELSARQIGTSVHFIPIHIHPYYVEKYGFAPDAFPVAFSNYERLISLPLNAGISDADVARVAEAVLDIVGKHRR
ncbi:DegT/DnrJ/EryC1/StrS aminotransferase family protein [bacterium]|nr:DegT/DnrJ/EryC1/StrS aminotransferase family protein [bacterium]